MKPFYIKNLLVTLLLLCGVAMSGSATEVAINGIVYNLYSGEATVNYASKSYTFFTIPSTVDYGGETYTVRSIASGAFKDYTNLYSLSIPASVRSIGSNAFYGCTALKSITIPAGVTSIGSDAFYGCTALTSIEVDSGNTYYDSRDNCNAIIKTSTNTLVQGCNNTIIPDGVTSIGSNAFYGCTGLTSITIPSSVTSIGSDAFYGCTALASIEVDSGNTYYDSRDNCNAIIKTSTNTLVQGCKNTIIPSSVTSIGSNAFYDCTGLASITIPSSVTSIGSDAFYGCTGLTSITIPSSVTSIGSSAFYGCTGLTDVHISDLVAWCKIDFSDNYSYPFYYADNLYINGKLQKESLVIPEGVEKISAYLFPKTEFYSVTIPSTVLYIGENAFSSNVTKMIILGNTRIRLAEGSDDFYVPSANRVYVADSLVHGFGIEYPLLSSLFEVNGVKYVLKSAKDRTCDVIDCAYDETAANIAIDSVVTYRNIKLTVKNVEPYALYKNNYVKSVFVNNDGYVGDSAFYQCAGIDSDVVIKNNGYVGERSFYQSSLTGLNISNTGYIDDYAFYDCTNMNSEVTVSNDGYVGKYAFSKSTLTGLNISNKGYIGDHAFYNCTNMNSEVTVSNDGYVGSYAFSESTLTGLNISNNGHIGNYAFYNCPNINEVIVSNNGYIGTCAFYNCPNINKAIVSNSGSIGASAFRGCTALATLNFGENVTSFGNSAFRDCTSLPNIVIPDFTPSVGASCFQNCSSLASAVVGKSITKLNVSTFRDCVSLTDMTIGVNVTSVNDSVFYNCSSLPKIDIPQKVVNVGDYVFDVCSKLAVVVFEDSIANIELGSNGESPMFSSCPLDSVYIGRKLSYTQSSANGYSPFYANKHLRSVTYNDNEVAVYPREYMNCTNLQNVLIGAGINVIDDNAFNGCTSLPTILIPNTVNEALGESSFANCTSLRQAVIGDSVPSIEASAFYNCISLVDVKIGARVTDIYGSAFKKCRSLNKITIPQATNSIADYVFDDCAALKYFFLEDGPNAISLGKNAATASTNVVGSACPLFYDCALDSVYLGRDLSYNRTLENGYSPFYFNKTLRAVVIGDQATQVHENEFYKCQALKYVSVGDGVTAVGNWAFSGCISLDHFSFGTGLESIGKEAFSDCTSVTKIVSSRDVPPVCGDQALADINVWDCTLYVPEDYIETYWAALQWQDFFFIEGAEYNLKFIVDGEVYSESVVKYNAEITLPADPVKEGYTFLGWKFDDDNNVWNGLDISGNANTMLYTNAPCTTTAYGDQFVSWDVLSDGDANTIFHSEYGNKQTADSLDHYLRVDMGERNKVGKFSFTYTTRNLENNNNVAPKTMVVEGSNVADGEYTEIATLSNLPGTKATVYTSAELGDDNNPFRYIRYRVTETHSNYKDNNHPYFAIAEFDMSAAKLIYEIPSRMPADNTEFYAFFKANDYTVKYIVDGEVYYSETVACDAEIVPVEAPEKEGYTFNRWEGLPVTMPAGDIEVTAVYDKIPTEVTITINKYGSATYASPYALDFSEVSGLTAYAATGYNTSTGVITMTNLKTAKAGVGLFLKGTPNTTYVVPILEDADDKSLNLMIGVLTKTTVNQTTDDGLYVNFKYTVLSGSTTPMFYRYSDGSSVSAGKAYLQLPQSWLPSDASFAIGIRFEDGFATDIDEITDNSEQSTEIYDLNGLRVLEPVKGVVYIVNGKKVIF